jgi:hypothetical protein
MRTSQLSGKQQLFGHKAFALIIGVALIGLGSRDNGLASDERIFDKRFILNTTFPRSTRGQGKSYI